MNAFIHSLTHSTLTEDRLPPPVFLGFPCGSAGKESTCNAGDLSSIPGLWRSPGEGKGYPLQYSGLENSMHCMGLQRVRHDWVAFTFPFILHLLSFIYFFFTSRKMNVENTVEVFQANVEPLLKFVAETPLSKQATRKRSLETNSSCHVCGLLPPPPPPPPFSSLLSNSVCNKTYCSNGLVV